jgi:hypothetical protein
MGLQIVHAVQHAHAESDAVRERFEVECAAASWILLDEGGKVDRGEESGLVDRERCLAAHVGRESRVAVSGHALDAVGEHDAGLPCGMNALGDGVEAPPTVLVDGTDAMN